ncbi:MAG: hypothetical protein J6S79_04770 [Lachnospiraceae bacterium]|nr:hypothetical protein [Lachnospiraceae bacterium]
MFHQQKEVGEMKYKIISGRYESGTEEQQAGYAQLFGGDVQHRFDLYFHWYNLIHEVGHCLVEQYGKQMPQVKEEMFVNEFAVAYYRYAGESERLGELQGILQGIIDQMPSPVPKGETFLSFYERIWGTEELMQVLTYGYFQLNSVLEAMKSNRGLAAVAAELGATLREDVRAAGATIKEANMQASEATGDATLRTCDATVSSAGAAAFLETAVANLKALGLTVPEIKLELTDNPMIQCAQPEAE